MSARRVPSVTPLCSTLRTSSSHSCGIALRFGRGGGSAKNQARSTPGATGDFVEMACRRARCRRWCRASARQTRPRRCTPRPRPRPTERSAKVFPRPRSYTIRRAGSSARRAATCKKAANRSPNRQRHPDVFAATITLRVALGAEDLTVCSVVTFCIDHQPTRTSSNAPQLVDPSRLSALHRQRRGHGDTFRHLHLSRPHHRRRCQGLRQAGRHHGLHAGARL